MSVWIYKVHNRTKTSNALYVSVCSKEKRHHTSSALLADSLLSPASWQRDTRQRTSHRKACRQDQTTESSATTYMACVGVRREYESSSSSFVKKWPVPKPTIFGEKPTGTTITSFKVIQSHRIRHQLVSNTNFHHVSHLLRDTTITVDYNVYCW